jgi:hypothetical protein
MRTFRWPHLARRLAGRYHLGMITTVFPSLRQPLAMAAFAALFAALRGTSGRGSVGITYIHPGRMVMR